MKKSLKNFFLFSLLLAFIFNVSGMSVHFEHVKHSKNIDSKVKDSKNQKTAKFSQDEDCHCALHLQMNHFQSVENLSISTFADSLINDGYTQSEAFAYRCLLDYFSSRAPPYFS